MMRGALRGGAPVVLVVLTATALLGACGSGGAGAAGADTARLEQAAREAGTALDIWVEAHDGVFPPRRFTARVWAGSGLRPTAGTRVVRYRPGTSWSGGTNGTMAAQGDSWQLCVVGTRGGWVTYGSSSGVQAKGRSGRACRFSGDHDPRAGFDHRLWVQSAYDALTADDPAKEGAGWRFPTRLDGATMSELGLSLPEGWRVPRFAQPGWTRVQLCLTGPDGRWFRTADRWVVATGTGRCRLDPRFRGEQEYLMWLSEERT